MKKSNFLSYIGLLRFIFLFSQCEKQSLNIENDVASLDEANFSNARTINEAKSYSDDDLVLGKKLEIPYKLAIVEKSQNTLKSKTRTTNQSKLKKIIIMFDFYPKMKKNMT